MKYIKLNVYLLKIVTLFFENGPIINYENNKIRFEGRDAFTQSKRQYKAQRTIT